MPSGAVMVKIAAMTKTIRAKKRSDIGGSSFDPTGELLSRRRNYRGRQRKGKAGFALFRSRADQAELLRRAASGGGKQHRRGPKERPGDGEGRRRHGAAQCEDRRGRERSARERDGRSREDERDGAPIDELIDARFGHRQ